MNSKIRQFVDSLIIVHLNFYIQICVAVNFKKSNMQDKRINIFLMYIFILPVIFIFGSCYHLAAFSEREYYQAVGLKVASLELMRKAVDDYSKHSAEADSLRHNLKLAFEYAKGRPDNDIITKQWEIMIDPDRNLIGGFLRIWEEDIKLSPAFINEAQSVIGDAFDTIIGLESGKLKSSDLPEGQTSNEGNK